MQVKVEHQNPCQVELTIEVPAEEVVSTMDRVYREMGKHTQVPGFRKGKAPRAILERHVSEESVRRHTMDDLLPQAYADALQETKVEPYTDPEIEIVQFENEQPLIFKARVPLPPKIELGEYKGIEVERAQVGVTDEDIEAELKYIQDSRAKIEPAEGRGIQTGDIAMVEMTTTIEGEEPAEARRTLVRVGSNVPAFDEQMIGMNPGDEKSFDVDYPQDAPDEAIAGKKMHYAVKVESIREVKLPELNDEFAQAVGEFKSIEELKDEIRRRLTDARNSAADQEVENRIIEEIVSRSSVCFPDVIVESRVSHDLQHLREDLEKEGRNMRQYLDQIGKTRDEFMEELKQAITRRVTAGLVLGELAEKENLRVTDEELDARIDQMAEEAKTTREAVEAYMEPRGGRDSLENAMLDARITDFLKSVSNIKSGESAG